MATIDEYIDRLLAEPVMYSLAEMDEHIDWLLAEMPEPVVNNILDEPISEAVKERPLLPRKYRPSPPPSPQGQGEEKEGHSRGV